MEASELPAIGIADDRDIEGAEVPGRAHQASRAAILDAVLDVPRQQDEAGAGRKDRHAALDALPERLEESLLPEEPSLDGRLAARQDEAVEGACEVVSLPELE